MWIANVRKIKRWRATRDMQKKRVDKNNWATMGSMHKIMSCKLILVDSTIAYGTLAEHVMLLRELNHQLCKHLCLRDQQQQQHQKKYSICRSQHVWIMHITLLPPKIIPNVSFPCCVLASMAYSVAVFFAALSVWTFPVPIWCNPIWCYFFYINNLQNNFYAPNINGIDHNSCDSQHE